jgi:ParB-like chromosome segregation protein Spo0J
LAAGPPPALCPNAKTHDADQVAKIAASMAEFGWTVPCLVAADGELIAGHGRVLAAAQLGLAEAPVIVLGHLTEAQRRAYRIADNKLTELGGWDEALLLEELRAPDGRGFRPRADRDPRGRAGRAAARCRRPRAHRR